MQRSQSTYRLGAALSPPRYNCTLKLSHRQVSIHVDEFESTVVNITCLAGDGREIWNMLIGGGTTASPTGVIKIEEPSITAIELSYIKDEF